MISTKEKFFSKKTKNGFNNAHSFFSPERAVAKSTGQRPVFKSQIRTLPHDLALKKEKNIPWGNNW